MNRHVRWGQIAGEAVSSLWARPSRALLTAAGVGLGVSTLVAVVGLTATAGASIDSRFESSFSDVVVARSASSPMPLNAPAMVDRIDGVDSAGVLREVRTAVAIEVSPQTGAATVSLPMYAVSASFFEAASAEFSIGRAFESVHGERHDNVAVVGAAAARDLGIATLVGEPSVWVEGRSYLVIGIMADAHIDRDVLRSILVPLGTSGETESAELYVRTDPGAAYVVADQLAPLLSPEDPSAIAVQTPLNAEALRASVDADIQTLLVFVSGITLLISGIGIANTMLVSVLERVPEIGMRRALGAGSSHIVAQVLAEGSAVGTGGGVIGTAIGVVVVTGVALAKDWVPSLPTWILAAPAIGLVVGLVASAYPALRAGRIPPQEALRR